MALGEKDHQHADGDDDERRQDQKQVSALGMLVAAVVGTFVGTSHGIALPEDYLRL
jgi:hypothetical protein